MGCDTCSNNKTGTPRGCKSNGTCESGGCNKMGVFDWLANMELGAGQAPFDCIEVRFKNGRKGFYRTESRHAYHVGDVVVVDVSPGHDVGVVTLTGELVRIQMNKKGVSPTNRELKKVYRKATEDDLDKWQEARNLEYNTMHKARTIALELRLQMKISDVEYQGDKTKATFYYTADDRVDFRELIKKMADSFKVRIEMRQIGVRQEAGRLGGIGSCGRELCCSTWLTDFRSVNTGAARYQQLSLNPQKLAGQCGKLKCCLNYELDVYVDTLKDFPDTNTKLQLRNGYAVNIKIDVFKRLMYYQLFRENMPSQIIALTVENAKDIIEKNKAGVTPEDLKRFTEIAPVIEEPKYENVVGQDDLKRFDNKFKNKGGQNNNRNRNKRKDNNRRNDTRNRNNSNEKK
ncbi:MAG: stage 0 sporulation family protein [Flavobacteriales bacterium]